jgi:hypothetical protein
MPLLRLRVGATYLRALRRNKVCTNRILRLPMTIKHIPIRLRKQHALLLDCLVHIEKVKERGHSTFFIPHAPLILCTLRLGAAYYCTR